MDYINLKSQRGLVNLFADYILSKIITDHSIDASIEVTNCGKFFLVNGFTNSKNILTLHQVKDEFIEEYKSLANSLGYEQMNIVDTITYDVELTSKNEHSFNLYKTDRPVYSKEVFDFISSKTDLNHLSFSNSGFLELDYSEDNTDEINKFKYSPINISSEFPYGYSWKMGRDKLYYSEYVSNHLFNIINVDKLLFKFSLLKDENDDFKIRIISDSLYSEKTIISMVLDNFDLNVSLLKEKMSNYNLLDDILDPIRNKPWLVKDKTKGLIIF